MNSLLTGTCVVVEMIDAERSRAAAAAMEEEREVRDVASVLFAIAHGK